MQAARDFIGRIWDVPLKDTEILWYVLRKIGIHHPPYNPDGNSTEQFKAGFRVAYKFLRLHVPA